MTPARAARLELRPITLLKARHFIDQHHRHRRAPAAWKFGIALHAEGELAGVIVIGRPIARRLDDGMTAEVIRCCVREDVPNGCSRLYGAGRRAVFAMGYSRLITYTLASEPGGSLRAAGFTAAAETRGETWDRPSRHRDAGDCLPKIRWEIAA
jgi:hypothetical protein